MTETALQFSEDQAEAYDRIAEAMRSMGIDLLQSSLTPATEGLKEVAAPLP